MLMVLTDIADIALLGHFGHLLDIIGVEHDAGQSCECAAANTDTANVAHLVAVTFHKRGTRYVHQVQMHQWRFFRGGERQFLVWCMV